MSIPPSLLLPLEMAMNRALALDPASREALARLRGKVVRLEIPGLGTHFYVALGPGGVSLWSDFAASPDCTIRSAPVTLARFALAGGELRDPLGGDLEIDGDVELGQRLQRILRGLDIDWEEQLAQWVGDVAAHQISHQLTRLRGWGRQSLATFGQDVAEYLQEERRLLVTRPEVDGFLTEVDWLRADVDRLEARVQRLQPSPTE